MSATIFNWTGTTGDWSTPGDWTPSGPPGEGDAARIDNAAAVVTVSNGTSVGNLILSAGTVSETTSLDVLNAATINGGTLLGNGGGLTFGSSGTGSGTSLIVSGAGRVRLQSSTAATSYGVLTIGSNGGGVLQVSGGSTLDSIGFGTSGTPVATIGEGGANAPLSIVSLGGTGSTWNVGGAVIVGDSGKAVLSVGTGATLTTGTPAPAGNFTLAAGAQAGSSGTIIVAGGLVDLGGSGNLAVGYSGTGQLVVSQAGTLLVGSGLSGKVESYIADQSGSSASATITDRGSVMIDRGGLQIGAAGNGTLTVTNQASLTINDNLALGAAGGTGSFFDTAGAVVQVGGAVSLANGSTLAVGAAAALEIGGTSAPPILGQMRIDNGGTLRGAGIVEGSISNIFGGLVAAEGGTLELEGVVSQGVYSVAAGSELQFDGGMTGTVAVVFGSETSDYGVAFSNGDSSISAYGDGVIATGSQSTAFIFTNGNEVVLSRGHDTVIGSAGAATVSFAGTQGVLFYGASTGLDVTAMGIGSTLVGGSSAITLTGQAGGGYIFAPAVGGSYVATGERGTFIFGGGDGDTLVANNGSSDLLYAGPGRETLNGSASSGNLTLWGGAGSDVMTGGSGTDLFQAGHGNATMVGGSGTDYFFFVNGAAGGANVIDNFDTSGRMDVVLSGYASGEGSRALAHATTVDGSLVLTLSDKTTITFHGLTSVPGGVIFG